MATEVSDVCFHGDGKTTTEICLCFIEAWHLGFDSGLEKQLDFAQWCTL